MLLVIDALSRRIVGWQVLSWLRSDLALDALEDRLYMDWNEDPTDAPRCKAWNQLVIATPNLLAESGIEPLVGSSGDSYDNTLARLVVGLKTRVIRRRGASRSL